MPGPGKASQVLRHAPVSVAPPFCPPPSPFSLLWACGTWAMLVRSHASKYVKVSTDGEGYRDHLYATGAPLPDRAAAHRPSLVCTTKNMACCYVSCRTPGPASTTDRPLLAPSVLHSRGS